MSEPHVISSEAPLSVRSVTMLTGLNEHTLRAWERRYGAVKPQRTAAGRRFYSRVDVERLRVLAGLVERGYQIGQIAALGSRELSSLMADSLALAASGAAPLPSVSRAHADIAEVLRAIASATAAYDLSRVHAEIAHARARFGARQFALEVVSPLMATVDQLIMRGEFTIAQEHALSAILRANLMAMILNLHRDGAARTFAIATMEGDLHELGILISALLCASHGFQPVYIGPNMPPEALAGAASAMGIGVVLLGVTALPPGILPLSLDDYLRTLAHQLPAACEIWVGGRTGLDPKALKLRRNLRRIETLTELDRLLETFAANR